MPAEHSHKAIHSANPRGRDLSRPYTNGMKDKWWAILTLFVVGATLGTALDPIDMYSQVTHYTIPWWLPPTFGLAAVAMGYVQPMLASLLGHVPPARRLWTGFAELTWLVLAYLVGGSSLASLAKVGLLLLIFLAFWWLAARSWQSLLLSIVTGITGTLVEMILVALGLYSFVHPNIFGVPYWLPGIYAVASLAVADLGSSLLHFFHRIAYNQAGNVVVDTEEG